MPKYNDIETFLNLSQAIDRMNFTQQEYDIILKIITNYDNALYIRILEEIVHGTMTWSDFFTIYEYDQKKFTEILETQEKIFNQISYINKANQILNDKIDLKNLILSNSNKNITNSINKLEKENQLLSMIRLESSDPIINFYNNAILKLLIDDDTSNEFIDKMLLSFHDYAVPVDYNLIILNEFDIKYMQENDLTETEMKKIKSLSAFMSNYYE